MKEIYIDGEPTSTVLYQLRHKETGEVLQWRLEVRDELDIIEGRPKAARALKKMMRERFHRWDDYETP